MNTYIALLRAVNVGGTGKLSMASLREILTNQGYSRVETYIQSGNAVFETRQSAVNAASAISAELEKLVGAPVQLLIRTHEELTRIIEENPFKAEAVDGTKVHVAFLSGVPNPEANASLEQIVAKYPARRDRFKLMRDTLYLHFPDGAADTKFSGKPLDRSMGVWGTGRNWNTVLKLHAMSSPR